MKHPWTSNDSPETRTIEDDWRIEAAKNPEPELPYDERMRRVNRALRTPSFNVAVAGSIVMYDRMVRA